MIQGCPFQHPDPTDANKWKEGTITRMMAKGKGEEHAQRKGKGKKGKPLYEIASAAAGKSVPQNNVSETAAGVEQQAAVLPKSSSDSSEKYF